MHQVKLLLIKRKPLLFSSFSNVSGKTRIFYYYKERLKMAYFILSIIICMMLLVIAPWWVIFPFWGYCIWTFLSNGIDPFNINSKESKKHDLEKPESFFNQAQKAELENSLKLREKIFATQIAEIELSKDNSKKLFELKKLELENSLKLRENIFALQMAEIELSKDNSKKEFELKKLELDAKLKSLENSKVSNDLIEKFSEISENCKNLLAEVNQLKDNLNNKEEDYENPPQV